FRTVRCPDPAGRECLSSRALAGPAQLDRARLSQTDPIQPAPQRRALRRVGAAAAPFRRGSRGLPIPALVGEGDDGHTVCPSSCTTAETLYSFADLSTIPLTGWSTRIQERNAHVSDKPQHCWASHLAGRFPSPVHRRTGIY